MHMKLVFKNCSEVCSLIHSSWEHLANIVEGGGVLHIPFAPSFFIGGDYRHQHNYCLNSPIIRKMCLHGVKNLWRYLAVFNSTNNWHD